MGRIARAGIFETVLTGLFDLFGGASGLVDWRTGENRREDPPHLLASNTSLEVDVDVVVCTVADRHVLDCLEPSLRRRINHAVSVDRPQMLGYVARDFLGRHPGKYDFYCYLEDDVLLTDRMFFHKLGAVTPSPEVVILPNRCEIESHRPNRKVYTDGPYHIAATDRLAPLVLGDDGFQAEYGGASLRFRKVRNPHAGCFFLSAAQMEVFAASPAIRDLVPNYVGPLESAATLGLLQTFRVFKPDRANADFLEARHLGGTVIQRMGL